jgi:hypothetical protein
MLNLLDQSEVEPVEVTRSNALNLFVTKRQKDSVLEGIPISADSGWTEVARHQVEPLLT